MLSRAVPGLVAALTIIYLLLLFHSQAYPEMFQDDFFYYALTARHILAGHGSTFDGTHMTNGYHPLWMVVVLAVTAVFHAGVPFYAAFCVIIAAAVFITYALLVAVFRNYTGLVTSQCLAAFFALNFLTLNGGMEVTLTVPLLCLLVFFRLQRFDWNQRAALLMGVLSAAVVLSRLDSAIFITCFAVLDLLLSTDTPWRKRLAALPSFVLGMTPILMYLTWNQVRYHSALPISAHAKELRLQGGFAMSAIHSLWRFEMPLIKTLVRPALVILPFAAAVLLFLGRGLVPIAQRGLVFSLLLFMPLHILALSLTSDWRMWEWYLYPLLMSCIGACIILLTRKEPFFQRRYFMSGFLAAMLLAHAAFHLLKDHVAAVFDLKDPTASFYLSGVDFAAFANTHPGVYAMGDRAGLVGYMLPSPLIQTEGLMMDKAYLENIRQQRNLIQVLRSYGVRYFIATNPVADGACDLVREPAQAGPSAPTMSARFCAPPVHAFSSDPKYKSYIFDMKDE